MAAAAARAVQAAVKKVVPLFDRVLVEKAEAVTKTKGGLYIPEKAQGKVVTGTVVATGPGHRNEKGETVPVSVQIGDSVLLPEYGGTKVELEDKEFFLYREHDILAKLKE
ncbi:10 kDa heat shock protein, mitochondrial [Folsomia candida]|uniref:10 kDa heat shock protein, mitochondrial n=1 Tax=Folsomia candida TaxID=158441 RepID=UPI000B901298|nr:10 kDa heat shock protein, mitochondrial [Folsomia candida]